MVKRTYAQSTLKSMNMVKLLGLAQFHNNRLKLGANLAGKGRAYIVDFILENQNK